MRTRIPLPVLFGNADRVVPSISPDGQHLAWLAPHGGVLNIHVDGRPRTAEQRSIRSYWWAGDSQHLTWVRDDRGDENFHLIRLDLATAEVTDLTPFPGVRAQVVAVDAARTALVVGLNRRDPRVFDLYRVGIGGGSCQLVAENPGVDDWLVDPNLAVVGATRTREDGQVEVVVPAGDGTWSVVNPDVGDYLAALPLGVTATGDLILRTDKDHAARYLARLDLRTGRLSSVFADPTYDIRAEGVVLHPRTREPQLVVVDREKPETVVLDPDIQGDIDALLRLPHGRPVILSRDRLDRHWIVGYLGDQGPVPHYRWDRTARTAAFLFDHRPVMHEHRWAPMEPFEYTARDGLTIHGYLTFPPGRGREHLPGVLAVHGGPWRRHSWGLDPEGQWLADRGYLCIQVNFRGSAGYGRDFLDAGDKEWGGRMQDDLVDAVDHLVATGHLDPARVGIMGVSYGGYATLAALTSTDVFACGIARCGPANLITFIESIPPYFQPHVDLWHRRIGHPVTERDLLWSRSPLSRAHQLDRPLLLVHGARDVRVPRAESDALVAALRENGIDHEYLVFEDEGHGIDQPHNREAFYERAEQFLARHLPVDDEDDAST